VTLPSPAAAVVPTEVKATPAGSDAPGAEAPKADDGDHLAWARAAR